MLIDNARLAATFPKSAFKTECGRRTNVLRELPAYPFVYNHSLAFCVCHGEAKVAGGAGSDPAL